MTTAEVIRVGVLDIQVCVPGDWTDNEVETFANSEHPAGTTNGWRIRTAADPAQQGAPTRVQCKGGPDGNVHIVLTC